MSTLYCIRLFFCIKVISPLLEDLLRRFDGNTVDSRYLELAYFELPLSRSENPVPVFT